MSDTGTAITGAGLDLGSGLTAVAQVGAGALLVLIGFLLATGLSKSLTRTAVAVARVAVVHR